MAFFKREGWFGHSDASTSRLYFAYDAPSNAVHHTQMAAVVQRMRELADLVDGNGRAVFEFVYANLDVQNPIIAFRFTSDWAYDQYNAELVKLGSSLGRGVFKPWGSDPASKYFFDRYINQKPR